MSKREKLKAAVQSSYRKWKQDERHRSVRKYFTDIQREKGGKGYSRDCSGIYPSLVELAELLREQEASGGERLVLEREGDKTTFLGSQLEVEDDDEVEEIARETIFAGFRKTIDKLLDAKYLKSRSTGDVLKKLLKKLMDFMEVGLQGAVIAIGYTIGHIISLLHPLPEPEPHSQLGILCLQDHEFVNYGETVLNKPNQTFFPKTIEEIQSIIRYGRETKRRVRCAGMKHSWSQVFSDDGEILVYLLPLAITDTISFTRNGLSSLESVLRDWNSQLSGIEVIEELEGSKHAAVRVGAATTNLEMLNWSNKSGWTLPVDIIAVMITYGGSNAMICHGAGLHTKTLSDLVLKLEFIDAKGDYRTEDDPDKLKALAGCFGLAGIVTFITFKMDAMSYARFHPKKTLMRDSIPKPGADQESPEFKRMVELCSGYYVEFFWFPSHGEEKGYWENCWNNDGREEDAIDINLGIDDNYQISSTFLFEVIMKVLQPLTLMTREDHYDDKTSLEECLKYIFSKTVSLTGHKALPEPTEPATTSLVEALHFRRGFHYIAVREMEMEIPIPSLPDGGPDWSIIPRAWWDAVHLIQEYENRGIFAVDMALELRVMGGSDVLMAPQYGNTHGTLAIEPVSTRIVHSEIWEDFKEDLARIWMSYKDAEGNIIKSRVHWAKESPRSVQIDGEHFKTIEYWQQKEVYGANMETFFNILSEYNSVEDMYNIFSNHYLDVLFEPQWTRFGIEQTQKQNGIDHLKSDGGSSVPGPDRSSCCSIA